MSPKLHSLSIVLPCHDEVANVARVARQAVRVGREVADRLEVLVVDDGSRDGTGDRATDLADELPELRVARNSVNQGYGGALRRGFQEAQMAWVFFTDGDGQFELDQLPELVALTGRCEMAIGYRHRRMDAPWRIWNGRAWTTLVNMIFDVGVRDLNCAFKLFPSELVRRVDLASSGAAINAELLLAARHLGYRVAEWPVRHRVRMAGRQSGNNPEVVGRAVVELIRLAARQSGFARRPESPGVLP